MTDYEVGTNYHEDESTQDFFARDSVTLTRPYVAPPEVASYDIRFDTSSPATDDDDEPDRVYQFRQRVAPSER